MAERQENALLTYAVDFCVVSEGLLVNGIEPVVVLCDQVVRALSLVDDTEHVLSRLPFT